MTGHQPIPSEKADVNHCHTHSSSEEASSPIGNDFLSLRGAGVRLINRAELTAPPASRTIRLRGDVWPVAQRPRRRSADSCEPTQTPVFIDDGIVAERCCCVSRSVYVGGYA
ncbi:hypothetical protein LSAT2_021521 [Lamellibrachia satsuma]|nr:hypothetical protein LSAT2_021521 [Lamellibrachia satsuma]